MKKRSEKKENSFIWKCILEALSDGIMQMFKHLLLRHEETDGGGKGGMRHERYPVQFYYLVFQTIYMSIRVTFLQVIDFRIITAAQTSKFFFK